MCCAVIVHNSNTMSYHTKFCHSTNYMRILDVCENLLDPLGLDPSYWGRVDL